jgi:hypothetical protein
MAETKKRAPGDAGNGTAGGSIAFPPQGRRRRPGGVEFPALTRNMLTGRGYTDRRLKHICRRVARRVRTW